MNNNLEGVYSAVGEILGKSERKNAARFDELESRLNTSTNDLNVQAARELFNAQKRAVIQQLLNLKNNKSVVAKKSTQKSLNGLLS